MSLTFAESLAHVIQVADNEATVSILEPRVQDGSATDSEKLLCGVLLLLPPLADYESAASIFTRLFVGPRRFEAAVWDAYRFSVLLPSGSQSFEKILRGSPQSAVAAHMLSTVAAACDDVPLALAENRRSRALRLFPLNVIEALKQEPELKGDARKELWENARDLIVSRSAESDKPVCTVEGALQRRWDNLIVGTRITTPLWDEYARMFELQ